jgi:hypothetical protein
VGEADTGLVPALRSKNWWVTVDPAARLPSAMAFVAKVTCEHVLCVLLPLRRLILFVCMQHVKRTLAIPSMYGEKLERGISCFLLVYCLERRFGLFRSTPA